LYEELCTFMTICCWILFGRRNILDKIYREYQDKYFMFKNFFFRKLCCLWNNVEMYGRTGQATDSNVIPSMRCAFVLAKATNTYSEYIILLSTTIAIQLRLNITLYHFACLVHTILEFRVPLEDGIYGQLKTHCLLQEEWYLKLPPQSWVCRITLRRNLSLPSPGLYTKGAENISETLAYAYQTTGRKYRKTLNLTLKEDWLA
jgi:hypothetical protein